MGLSTDEGVSRGELREELQAFEQRLDKRLDKRFDILEAKMDQERGRDQRQVQRHR